MRVFGLTIVSVLRVTVVDKAPKLFTKYILMTNMNWEH